MLEGKYRGREREREIERETERGRGGERKAVDGSSSLS